MDWLRLFGRRPKSSSIARERLKVVISQDRFNFNVDEESMRSLQLEIMQVLSKHFDFQIDAVRMSLKQRGNSYVLTADFPQRRAAE